MSDNVQRFEAEFKSTPGKLSLTATHIAWVPNVAGAMDNQQQNMGRVINMLASKAGRPKISLKLVFKDDLPAGGLLFGFIGQNKEDDRKAVQDILIPFVSYNKGVGPAPPGLTFGTNADASSSSLNEAAKPSNPTAAMVAMAKGSNGVASPLKGNGEVDSPGGSVSKKRKLDLADTPTGASTPGTPTPITEQQRKAREAEFSLRKKVLAKNPHLKSLHRELVLGKQISEKEFWEGREALIENERLAQSLKPGRPSRLLDDRFDLDPSRSKGTGSAGGTGVGVKQKESGPMILNITKELTREIFEEFPVVQDAYARHVPGISEAEFWMRYFQSQLWEQHRASVRKTANDSTNKKKDDIFDAYLEDPDWELAPRKEVDEGVGRVIDLAATQEDHGDSDTIRDVTMQAGRERSSLPLIRRFNEHSNKLLRRAGEKKTLLSNVVSAEDLDIYGEIDLEDLHGPAEPTTIALEVGDADEAVNGDTSGPGKGVINGKTDEELLDMATTSTKDIQAWALDFSGVSLPNPNTINGIAFPLDRPWSAEEQKAVDAFTAQRLAQKVAMQVVRDLHTAGNAENAVNAPFPPEILDAMRSCHNAATEFLRQFWSAVLPTPPGALGTNANTGSRDPNAAEVAKAMKAERMAGYLKLTEGKVEAVVSTARAMGIDPGRVRAALAPTVGAVNVALKREEKRLMRWVPGYVPERQKKKGKKK